MNLRRPLYKKPVKQENLNTVEKTTKVNDTAKKVEVVAVQPEAPVENADDKNNKKKEKKETL